MESKSFDFQKFESILNLLVTNLKNNFESSQGFLKIQEM